MASHQDCALADPTQPALGGGRVAPPHAGYVEKAEPSPRPVRNGRGTDGMPGDTGRRHSMNRTRLAAAGLALGLTLASSAAHAQVGTAAAWLHVRVEEGPKGSKVSVNLPLTLVEAALQAAPDTIADGGKIHLGCS